MGYKGIMIESFMELFTILMIHNILFDRKKKKDILISVVAAVICTSTYKIPVVSMIFPIVTFAILVKFRYRETLKDSFIKILISFVGIMIMECIVGIIVGIIGADNADKYLKVILFCVFTISLIIINSIKKLVIINSFEILKTNIKIIMFGFMNILIIIFIIKFINNKINLSNESTKWIFLLLIAFFVISAILCKEIFKEIADKKSLENQVRCNLILDECFKKLKESEHEYKNHLNTIYSMLEVGSDEQVRDMVKDYINQNKNNDSLNGLIYIDNIILRAIIYSKLSEAEEAGIIMEHNIQSNLKNICINEPKLVVVLTNLLTNAVEAARESNNPLISVSTKEVTVNEITKYTIEVKNTVRDANSINLTDIFNVGYSSKNKDRGYGLYNVAKIVDENGGNILVEIVDNMLSIKVQI